MKNLLKNLSLIALLGVGGAQAMMEMPKLGNAEKEQISKAAIDLYLLQAKTIEFVKHVSEVRTKKAQRVADDKFYQSVITKLGNNAAGLYYQMCEGGDSTSVNFNQLDKLQVISREIYAVWHTFNSIVDSGDISTVNNLFTSKNVALFPFDKPADANPKEGSLDGHLQIFSKSQNRLAELELNKLKNSAPADYRKKKETEYQALLTPLLNPKATNPANNATPTAPQNPPAPQQQPQKPTETTGAPQDTTPANNNSAAQNPPPLPPRNEKTPQPNPQQASTLDDQNSGDIPTPPAPPVHNEDSTSKKSENTGPQSRQAGSTNESVSDEEADQSTGTGNQQTPQGSTTTPRGSVQPVLPGQPVLKNNQPATQPRTGMPNTGNPVSSSSTPKSGNPSWFKRHQKGIIGGSIIFAAITGIPVLVIAIEKISSKLKRNNLNKKTGEEKLPEIKDQEKRPA